MSKRYDVCQGRESNGKTYWNKIATLWQNDDGRMSISFDSLPVANLNPKNGQVETRAMVFEAKSKGERGSTGGTRGGGGFSDADYGGGSDDDVPFISQVNTIGGAIGDIDRI